MQADRVLDSIRTEGGAMERGFDKDATIRSNRSNRSNRSLQNALPNIRTYRVQATNASHQQILPPPPYHAPSHSPEIRANGLRRDTSPSTVSLESGRWDDASRNQRWSIWTADTTLNSSDGGDYMHTHDDEDDDEHHALKGDGILHSVAEASSETSLRMERYMHYDDDNVDGAGPSSYPSRASTPPSPTTEAALDAALSSTMLALTTANSLLLSTMSSRRELARLRAMEAALDQEMLRKEADIRRKIEANRQMTRWMERACRRLEDVIEGRDGETSINEEELNELMSSGGTAPMPSSSLPGSRFMARHYRAPSTAVADAREVPIPFGIVEAKDTNATVGKSAAKRLERMLQRSSQISQATIGETSASSLPFAPHSRTSSVATSASGADVSRPEASSTNGTAASASLASAMAPRASRIRQASAGNALHLKLSTGKPAATTLTAPASVAPQPEQSLRHSGTSSRQSMRSDSEFSAAPSSAKACDGAEEDSDVGNTSSASRLLSTFINHTSRPTSKLSVHNDDGIDPARSPMTTNRENTDRPNSTMSFLTPPMPTMDLFDDSLDSHSTTTPLRHRPSLSSTRSPSALRMDSHTRGTGSSVTDEALGVAAIRDDRTSRKGALEALRKLNGGGSGEQSALAPSAATSTATSVGWGGTLASWMRIGGGGADANEAAVPPTPSQADSSDVRDE